jgi:hypothetical protein
MTYLLDEVAAQTLLFTLYALDGSGEAFLVRLEDIDVVIYQVLTHYALLPSGDAELPLDRHMANWRHLITCSFENKRCARYIESGDGRKHSIKLLPMRIVDAIDSEQLCSPYSSPLSNIITIPDKAEWFVLGATHTKHVHESNVYILHQTNFGKCTSRNNVLICLWPVDKSSLITDLECILCVHAMPAGDPGIKNAKMWRQATKKVVRRIYFVYRNSMVSYLLDMEADQVYAITLHTPYQSVVEFQVSTR